MSDPRGVSGPGGPVPGVSSPGGVSGHGGCLVQGGLASHHADPPGGQTHACENITFATSLRTVMSVKSMMMIVCVKFAFDE